CTTGSWGDHDRLCRRSFPPWHLDTPPTARVRAAGRRRRRNGAASLYL
ncbi:MAG: hypothetical protein AVDCRST_MAG69-2482, partial [uncultured Solirubrobacteraceae bacterium]